jgi:putative ABC transport system ATP-binding protein
MINEPLILLADEPTGALDSKTGQQILELFDELVEQGKTIILVTHDPSVAHRCSRIIHLHDGRVYKDEQNAQREVNVDGAQLAAGI